MVVELLRFVVRNVVVGRVAHQSVIEEVARKVVTSRLVCATALVR